MTSQGDAGFTLIEMLAALFIFSVLSAMSLSALTGTLRSQRTITDTLEASEELVLLDTLLRQDFSHVTMRATRDPLGTRELAAFELYPTTGELIRFTRGGRVNPQGLAPRGDLMRVSYELIEGDLVRRTPALPTPSVNTPVQQRVLVRDVRSLTVRAFAEDQEVLQVSVPPDGEDLPDRLEIEIERDAGGVSRHLVEIGR